MTGNNNNTSTEALAYYGTKGAYMYGYLFSNNKLKSSIVFVKTYYVEALAKHLTERYVKVDSDDDHIYMIDIDKKTVVIVGTEKLNGTYYYAVLYNGYSNNTNKTTSLFTNATRTTDIDTNKHEELMNALNAELNKRPSSK